MITRDFADEAAGYQSVLSEIRKDLHQIPEFGINLPKTRERVLASIHDLGEIHLSERQSSIVLHIKGGLPGPTVLLRADMDALAVTEATGLDFASTNGYMHACGHDLHMAIGIGAAHLLATHKDELKGDVIIWFQPGEEGHGGAGIMLEENLHMITGSKPIAAYGIHVTSSWQPPFTFGGKSGALMASASDMLVTFKGRCGHGSSPWMAKDPISAMTEAITALQTMVTKRFNAFDLDDARTLAADFCAHLDEHGAEVDDLRFAGRAFDAGDARCERGGHHDIGGTENRAAHWAAHKDRIAAGAGGVDLDEAGVDRDDTAEGLEAFQMEVDGAGADDAAAGDGHLGLAEATDERAQQANRRAHLADEVIGCAV
jgi:hypothetical protein